MNVGDDDDGIEGVRVRVEEGDEEDGVVDVGHEYVFVPIPLESQNSVVYR